MGTYWRNRWCDYAYLLLIAEFGGYDLVAGNQHSN